MSLKFVFYCNDHKTEAEEMINHGVDRLKIIWKSRFSFTDIECFGFTLQFYNEDVCVKFAVTHRNCNVQIQSEYGDEITALNNKRSIINMVTSCKDEEIFLQMLADNMVSADKCGSSTKISFLTKPEFIFDLMTEKSPVGIILWFPFDIFER